MTQSLMYKITHYVFNCNKILCRWKIKGSEICNYCDNVDDILHNFLHCEPCRILWYNILKWWNYHSNIKINVDNWDLEECLLFGFDIEGDDIYALNWIIIQAKKFYLFV